MAQTAYDLDYFNPARKQQGVEHRKVKRRKVKRKNNKKYLFNVLSAFSILLLVIGVINTQAKITEIQGDITSSQKQLHEAEARYDSLTLALESSINVMTVEERVKEMGLVKMEPGHVSYVRANDKSSIEVAKTGFAKWLEGAHDGFLNIVNKYSISG